MEPYILESRRNGKPKKAKVRLAKMFAKNYS